mgnify:CR=1 FL=1
MDLPDVGVLGDEQPVEAPQRRHVAQVHQVTDDLAALEEGYAVGLHAGGATPVGQFDEHGRPARAGEAWAVGSIATSAQEPLACAPLLGAPLSDTLRALTGTDLRIVSIVDTSTAQSLSDPSDDDLRLIAEGVCGISIAPARELAHEAGYGFGV